MSNDELLARRSFLKYLALLLGTVTSEVFIDRAWAGSGTSPAGLTADTYDVARDWHYEIAPWTGDDFVLGHRLRDADFPPAVIESERSVDFVIVGGGIAGLTAAHFLRDHNFLLLEQYADLGGQSRGGSFQGIEYTWGRHDRCTGRRHGRIIYGPEFKTDNSQR